MNTTKFLKVKVKSLAEEARIIRLEEQRAKARGDRETRGSLYRHRVSVVRNEARATLLAYGYLRGKKKAQIEKARKPVVYGVYERALAMVKKYGNQDLAETFWAWYNTKE